MQPAAWRAITDRPYGGQWQLSSFVGAGHAPPLCCALQPAAWRAADSRPYGSGASRTPFRVQGRSPGRFKGDMGSLREVRGEIEIPPPPLGPSGAGRTTALLAKERNRSNNLSGNFPALVTPLSVRERTGGFSSFSRKGSEKVGGLASCQNPLIALLCDGIALWLTSGGNALRVHLLPSQTRDLIRPPKGRGF